MLGEASPLRSTWMHAARALRENGDDMSKMEIISKMAKDGLRTLETMKSATEINVS